MTKILVTGGAGFIGSNFVRLLIERGGTEVVNLDALTYAGNLENLSEIEGEPGYTFVRGDIRDVGAMDAVFAAHRPEVVVHFAAESHVLCMLIAAQGDAEVVAECLSEYSTSPRNGNRHF